MNQPISRAADRPCACCTFKESEHDDGRCPWPPARRFTPVSATPSPTSSDTDLVERLNDEILETERMGFDASNLREYRAAIEAVGSQEARLREALLETRGFWAGQQILNEAMTGEKSLRIETAIGRIDAALSPQESTQGGGE